MANWITLSRFPLLLATVLILYLGSPGVRLAGAALLFVGLLLDTVDGIVARRTGSTSLLGSVLDIATDRAYELVLWVRFADLDLIPAAIPVIVIVRTTLTDALRSVGVANGITPFEQHRSAIGRFLVASPWMRTGYAVGKVATFCGLTLATALPETASFPAIAALQVAAWLTVALCIARGLPVLVSNLRPLVRLDCSSAGACPASVTVTSSGSNT